MLNYEKPVVLANDEASEGVYASSGSSSDCWTVEAVSVQNWDGSSHVFEVRAVHSTAVTHISSATTVTLSFSDNITSARSEFPCSYSGNTVTITRELLADAYYSGDSVTYKVWVSAADQAATEQMYCTGATIVCTHQTNVQGGYD